MFLSSFGPSLPDIPGVARHAEDIGLDAVWSGDHLSTDTPLLESTVVLSAAAAVTQRIRLGFAVMLLAMRQPAWAAKQVGSLQLISGNRVVLGVGVGGQWPGEWAAAGIPLGQRGRRTDAILETLPSLFGGEPTRLTTEPGEPVVTLAPATPMPPLWVGGMSEHALRRAVRAGAEGWLGSLITPEQVAGYAGTLTSIAEGDSAPVPAVGVIVFVSLAASGTAAGEEVVRYLTETYGLPREHAQGLAVEGSPARLAERLNDYVSAGASRFVIATFGADVRGQYDLVAEARTALLAG